MLESHPAPSHLVDLLGFNSYIMTSTRNPFIRESPRAQSTSTPFKYRMKTKERSNVCTERVVKRYVSYIPEVLDEKTT